MFKAVQRLSVLLALLVSISPAATAQLTWSEVADGGGDADSLLAGAQDLSGAAYSVIEGEFAIVSDIDLYKINIISVDSFAATTELNRGSHLDTELWLFDSEGRGVYYNDDTPDNETDMSLLPRREGALGPQSPGIYYLGVSVYELNALDAAGNEIFENPRNFSFHWDRVNAPISTNPLAGWNVFGTGGNPPGTYRVTMTGTGGAFINLANDSDSSLPESYTIGRAYPNPFDATTSVELSVSKSQYVTAAVYNAIGQEVASVYSGFLAAGNMETVRIDGSSLPSGSYFVRVKGEDFVSTQTVTVTR